MSKLEGLIKALCPNGIDVEWKSLGEVCVIYTGGEAPENSIKGVEPHDIYRYPIYGNGVEIYGYTDSYRIDKDAVTISSIGANTGTIYFRKAFFTPIIRLKVVIPKYDNLLSRYMYHYLSSQTITSKKSSVPNMNASDVKKIYIPIPPLKVQEEIVSILDTFTELTAKLKTELTAELKARKKQYTYYRDKLFSFEEGEVEWKALGELFDFKNGINKGKEFFGSGNSIVNYTDVFKKNKLYENSIYGKVQTSDSDIERFNCKQGDVFFTRTSETKDEIGYAAVMLSDIPKCVFSGFLLRGRPKTNLLLPEYCSYCFTSSQIRKEIINSSNMTTRVTTTGSILSKIKIPVPPLSEQERIVSILDKFDALTSSITEGLPREIELRQKQYEYYRNMLLSFPKQEV